MATIGWLRCSEPAEPRNGASKLKTPPSEATSQYPPVRLSAAMATMGRLRCTLPSDPRKEASPNANTPPSEETSQ